jgi:hypothetical protein
MERFADVRHDWNEYDCRNAVANKGGHQTSGEENLAGDHHLVVRQGVLHDLDNML